jgi:tripartite-type tricarboxylate transporter receptor subunit TctC
MRLISYVFSSLILFSGFVSAQSPFPDKSVKIIVPYTASGVADLVAREFATRLSSKWNQPVIVENRAGAGATLGMDYLAKSEANGYTLAFSAISPITLSPLLIPAPYDPQKDFAAVAQVMYSPVYVLATPRLTLKSFEELMKAIKTKPGSISIATSGYGTVGHLMVEQLQKKSGGKFTHIPYKGSGGQVLTDAMGGQFDVLLINPTANVNNLIEQNKLRVLAVSAPQRMSSLPQIKTLLEYGYPEANLVSLFGFFAPKRTPDEVVNKLNIQINQILSDLSVQEGIKKAQNVVITGTPAEFSQKIQRDYLENAKIIKEANITAD